MAKSRTLPAQKPVSALTLTQEWLHFPLNEGTGSTATNDTRATTLEPWAIAGTGGTEWTDKPGWFVFDGSGDSVDKTLADDAAIETVCDLSKCLLIGMQVCAATNAARKTLIHIGGNVTTSVYGIRLFVEGTATHDKFSIFVRDDAGTNSSLEASASAGAGEYTITAVSADAAAPLVTTSAAHELSVGDWTYVVCTDSIPALAGFYEVQTVPSTATYTISEDTSGGAGTTGTVGVTYNLWLVYNGVDKTAYFLTNQVGTMAITDSSPGSDFSSHGTISLSGGPGTPAIHWGKSASSVADNINMQCRRLLIVNYGASFPSDLTSKAVPALRDSGMLPTYEMI